MSSENKILSICIVIAGICSFKSNFTDNLKKKKFKNIFLNEKYNTQTYFFIYFYVWFCGSIAVNYWVKSQNADSKTNNFCCKSTFKSEKNHKQLTHRKLQTSVCKYEIFSARFPKLYSTQYVCTGHWKFVSKTKRRITSRVSFVYTKCICSQSACKF